jgi:hypothetical protein
VNFCCDSDEFAGDPDLLRDTILPRSLRGERNVDGGTFREPVARVASHYYQYKPCPDVKKSEPPLELLLQDGKLACRQLAIEGYLPYVRRRWNAEREGAHHCIPDRGTDGHSCKGPCGFAPTEIRFDLCLNGQPLGTDNVARLTRQAACYRTRPKTSLLSPRKMAASEIRHRLNGKCTNRSLVACQYAKRELGNTIRPPRCRRA